MDVTAITRRLSRPSARVRLTALYGAGVVATGVSLLTVVYLLLDRRADTKVRSVLVLPKQPGVPGEPVPGKPTPEQVEAMDRVAAGVRHDMMSDLLTLSVAATVVLGLIAVVLGWWMAGRVLRPVHLIATTARRLSSEDLLHRIRLRGPDDEFKRLADTFDAMLDRLADAFDSQRRFVANASHELRTPLAIQRAALEIGLDDTSPETVARVRGELLELNRRCERLVSGLLLLAQSERGLEERRPVRLDEVAGEMAGRHLDAARAAEVRLETSLRPVEVSGDALLLGQLVANLVSNAVRYNRPGGVVEVEVGADGEVVVRNTGPQVPAEEVPRLFEPFRRLGARRPDGMGLGLSIARSIATAHGGSVEATPRPSGGLEVRVRGLGAVARI